MALRTSVSILRKVCHKSSSYATTVSLTDNGRKMELHCSNDEERRSFHGIWLRHNCRCPACFSERTNMIMLPTARASGCKEIENAYLKDSNVFVKWRHTDHEGVFPLQWLKDNDYSSEQRRRQRHNTAQQPLVAESIPTIDFKDIISSDEGAYRWLKDINYYGLSLIQGIETPETALKTIGDTVFPHLLHYFGEIHDIRPEEDQDDLGNSLVGLNLHQDLVYYENPPGIFALNCVRNDPYVEGGESLIVDLVPVLQELRTNYPKSFKILSTTPVTFQRDIIGSEDQLDLRITKHHIVLNEYGEVSTVNWNIAHTEPLCADEDLVEDYYDAVADFARLMNSSEKKFQLRLNRGECLVFNNRRMVHGRTAIKLNGGVRHMKGFFVHTDYIRSQFLVLGRKLGKTDLSTKAFMHSLF